VEALETTAQTILKNATRALAATDNSPLTETCLKLYRSDARSVAVAVLRALTPGNKTGACARDNDADVISKRRLTEIADLLSKST
jgi:hypothetical protein